MLNVPLEVIGWDGDGLPGDGIDNVLNNYILEHGYQSLRGQGRFWDAPIFYPTPGMTGTTDPHIGMLPFYALLRTVGLIPERAFQVWFLSAFVFNYFSALWAARRLGYAPNAAAIAAFIFTFSLPSSAQIGHAQLMHRWLVPPTVVLAWQFLHTPSNRHFALLVACWLGQFFLSAYMAIFLAELVFVFVVLTAICQYGILSWSELFPRQFGSWFVRVLIILVTLITLLAVVSHHLRVTGKPDREYILLFAPEPRAWLAVFPRAVISEVYTALGLDFHDLSHECRLFAGGVPFLAWLIGLGMIRCSVPTAEGQRKQVVALLCWSSLLLALWVTRWGNLWLYEPILDLPGGGAVRAMGRIILVLLFPLGLATAAMFTWLWGHGSCRWVKVTAALLLLVLVAEQMLFPHSWKQEFHVEKATVSKLLRWQGQLENIIRQHPRPRILYVFPSELPPGSEEGHRYFRLQVVAMRAAQNVGIPCVNGYSGYQPLDWDYFPNYRELFHWLTKARRVPAGQLQGLVLIGEPEPDGDPEYEEIMRRTYPPFPLPPWE
jgi:hypothetical protein